MTYKQILKEFDELSPEMGKWRVDRNAAKSFLKQSFIKYLQWEVERLEKSKRVIIICSDTSIDEGIACRSCSEGYSSCDNAQQEFIYNQAISDQTTHINNQIKEIEACK